MSEQLVNLIKKSNDNYEVIIGSWSELEDGDVVTVTSAKGKSPIMIMVEPTTRAYPATWDIRRPTESLNRSYAIPVNDSEATIYAAANIIEITDTSFSVKFYNNNFVRGITYLYFAVFE